MRQQREIPIPFVPVDPAPFVAAVSQEGTQIVVAPKGRLDHHARATMVAALAEAIAHNSRELIIDLAGVDDVDAEGLDLIVHTKRFLKARGQQLILRSPSSHLASLLLR